MNNIREFIEQTLSDIEVLNFIPDGKVHFLHARKPNPPYVEYNIFDEFGEEWAENEEIATTYYVQVDIFSKGNYIELENKIKEKMINAGFDRSMCADLYEADAGLYHKAMRFFITLNN